MAGSVVVVREGVSEGGEIENGATNVSNGDRALGPVATQAARKSEKSNTNQGFMGFSLQISPFYAVDLTKSLRKSEGFSKPEAKRGRSCLPLAGF
jgi:hypothetical protein